MAVNAATTSDPALLGIYLNDHYAGATAGLELFRRAAANHSGTSAGPVLERLTAEIAEDRQSLREIMASLQIPVQAYKVAGGWAAEKIGRLKPNGRLLSRSPLSSLIELEGMHLGVIGKASGWHLLRKLAATEPRLDAGKLDELLARAERQTKELEELRLQAGAEALAR
ncbi:MAG: hypothetical protein LC779_03810 [Actinobacteria bacterium]|nr:hypothetical protein [Actinomycetota bacterium]